jgi:hypothetical protein
MAELMVLRIVTWTVLVGTGLFLVSEYFREMRESRARKWRRQIDASGNVLSNRAADIKDEAMRKVGLDI